MTASKANRLQRVGRMFDAIAGLVLAALLFGAYQVGLHKAAQECKHAPAASEKPPHISDRSPG